MNTNISSALGGSRAGVSAHFIAEEAEAQLSDFGTVPTPQPQQPPSWALQSPNCSQGKRGTGGRALGSPPAHLSASASSLVSCMCWAAHGMRKACCGRQTGRASLCHAGLASTVGAWPSHGTSSAMTSSDLSPEQQLTRTNSTTGQSLTVSPPRPSLLAGSQ